MTAKKRRVTSTDVAKQAGVSRTTVSFVLNDVPNVKIPGETRQRVLDAARKLGYYPDAAARSLASRRTNTIGLVLCQSPHRVFIDAFLPEVLRGVSTIARRCGLRIILESIEDIGRPDAYINLVRARHIDGMILSGPRADDEQLPHLVEEGFPIVLMGQFKDLDVYQVDVDNISGARTATEHLLSLGHRRIGLITHAPLVYTASADRLTGYRSALESAAVPYDTNLVRYGDFHEESGYRAMLELLALEEKPTAVFVTSDMVTLGALQAAKDQGLRVPHDVAFVGFDDIPLAAYIQPPLTTIHLPAWDLGALATDILAGLLSERRPPQRKILLPTKLIIRQSCGYRLRRSDGSAAVEKGR